MAENLRQRGDRSLHLPSSDDDPESGDSDHGAGPGPWPIVFRFEDIIFFLVFLKIFLPFLYHMRKSEVISLSARHSISASLWQNPISATTSWKECAELPKNEPSILDKQVINMVYHVACIHPENETTGYILIYAEGGLN